MLKLLLYVDAGFDFGRVDGVGHFFFLPSLDGVKLHYFPLHIIGQNRPLLIHRLGPCGNRLYQYPSLPLTLPGSTKSLNHGPIK